MTKPIRFDSDAQAELDAAVRWYDEQTKQWAVADDLLAAVDDGLVRIADSPLAFPLSPNVTSCLGIRRCSLHTFPFALVFLELPDEIRVVALAHFRRRPGYWRGRL